MKKCQKCLNYKTKPKVNYSIHFSPNNEIIKFEGEFILNELFFCVFKKELDDLVDKYNTVKT